MPLPLAADYPPMEAKTVEVLPPEGAWQYEPKWDGFRCLAFKDGARVELRSKSGQPLGRYFPEVAKAVAGLTVEHCVLDGEIVVPVDGRLSFEALQMRLHPAESRVRKLAAETPAVYILFDLLVDGEGRLLAGQPLSERRAALDAFFQRHGRAGLDLSPATAELAQVRRWADDLGNALDGVIAKQLDQPYRSGERIGMVKYKPFRSADCVVGGFRYNQGSDQVGSLLLGLYDGAGLLHHVGYTSTLKAAEKPALTRRLRPLVAPPGFTGRAPGGPSRWSTDRSSQWQPLRPELVVEVRYDHVTEDRFRHGCRLLRWRPDKAPRHCTFEQLGHAPDWRLED